MKNIRNLFEDVYQVNETKKYLKGKLEKKYQYDFSIIYYIYFRECQKHIYRSVKSEELQKSINASMNYLKKNNNTIPPISDN